MAKAENAVKDKLRASRPGSVKDFSQNGLQALV